MVGITGPGLGKDVVGGGSSGIFEFQALILKAGGGGDRALEANGLDFLQGQEIGLMIGEGQHDDLDLAQINLAPEIIVGGIAPEDPPPFLLMISDVLHAVIYRQHLVSLAFSGDIIVLLCHITHHSADYMQSQ